MERFAGRYTLVRPLGQGGMGQVWLALDHTTGRECALKRLERLLPRSERDSLRREFEVLTRVQHPAVVRVLELGFAPDGAPFYTMECVPGLPAHDALANGEWDEFYSVAARLAEGLAVLHSAGVVHGDVKPSNLLVAPDTRGREVRLLDFGLAALLDRDRKGHRGTPGFAAPEVVRGQPLSVASDLYSLGATLHVLALTVARGNSSGAKPLRPPADAAAATLQLDQAGVPPALATLLLRLLAADPAGRPADAAAVRRELEQQHPAARSPLAERLQAEVTVGRAAELARLERWLAAPAGRPLMVLTGAPGVGKSVLLRELGVRAALDGREVVALLATSGDAPGTLARQLLLRLTSLPARDAALSPPAEWERIEAGAPLRAQDLPALVGYALAAAAAQRAAGPARLILLDEFDRLESISRAFVRSLLAQDVAGHLRWVWSSQSEPGPGADALLLEAGFAEHMTLAPLAHEAMLQLLWTRLRQEPPADLAHLLWERAGGHAGLTVEMLRLSAERGVLRESADGLTVDRAGLQRLEWPASFAAACLGRLERLEAAPRAAAAALAAYGAPIAPEALARIEPQADTEAIDALRGAGLLFESAQGVRLQPPSLAAALLERLPERERARRFRDALAAPDLSAEQRFRLLRGAGRPEEALAEAARALEHNRDLQLLVEAAELAGEQAPAQAGAWEKRAGEALLWRGRYREARRMFERALERTPGPAEQAEMVALLGGVLLRLGDQEAARARLDAGLASAAPASARARMLVNRIALEEFRGAPEAGWARIGEAHELAQQSQDPDVLGFVLMLRASFQIQYRNQAERGADDARAAVDAYVVAGNDLGRLRALGVLTSALLVQRRHREAIGILREALAEAQQLDLRLACYELMGRLADHLSESGAWTESRQVLERSRRLAVEEGWPALAARDQSVQLVLAALSGDVALARRTIARCWRMSARHLPLLRVFVARGAAVTHRVSGQLRRAERAARRALMLAEAASNAIEITWASIELGLVRAQAGRWREAGRTWASGLVEAERVPSSGLPVLCSLLGRAHLRAGALAEAQARLEQAEAWLAGRDAPYARTHAAQLRTELALARGDAEHALTLAEGTLEAFGALPAPPDAAMAALEFARLADRHGLWSRLPIPDWLRRAAAAFELLGDRGSQGQALALAVEWYRRYSGAERKIDRERDLLQAVGRLLDSMSDLEQLTQAAMRLAVEQLDAERGVLLLAEGDPVEVGEDHELHPVVEHGAVDAATRDQAITYSRRVVQLMRRRGGAVVIPDARTEYESMSHSVVELGLRSILCVPLFVEQRVVGAVYLDDSRRPEAFGDPERRLLEGFAHLLAVAIENSRGQERVRRENLQLVGENLSLRREASARFRPHNIIGGSLAMQRVLATVEMAARGNSNVLITGENGTGKELIAKLLHHAGPRSLQPFVAVNCASIVPTLLEAELFGIEANVATGVKARPGRFLEANGGTLFLDEIGDMPVSQQAKLLRVLAEKAVTAVGTGRAVPVDVRIIAATNRDLRQAIAAGGFREDLWYRINVIPIEVPALRDRKADIPALAHHFAAVFASQQDREVPTLSPALLAVLMQSDWHGNVRELQNYIERLMAMTPGKVLHPDPLPHDLQERSLDSLRPGHGRRLEDLVAELEKRHVQEALDRNAGNQSRAARELGLTEQSLRYRLRKYSLPAKRHFRRTR